MFRALRNFIMGPPKNVVVIVGTTGVGKSQVSKRFNGEIINADSMQMYRGAPIITNKHPIEEREGIPHHVMNHIEWDEEYFIHRFEKEALSTIEDIHQRGKLPIIVGGTHYYLNSLLFLNKTIKSDKPKEESPNLLTEEQKAILDGPSDQVFEILKQNDPIAAGKFHPNDTRRIRRALEIFYSTNKKASEHYQEQQVSEKDDSTLRFNTLAFWLFAEKPILDKRLDDRVDKMLEQGGLNEINELYSYYSKSDPKPDCERGIWQVIGFKEFLPWLENGNDSEKELKKSIEDMKTRTRQYAKKQVKWIKNLLAVDLAKEENHNYCKGGRLFLLDATDLSIWGENVTERGVEVTKKFLEAKEGTINQAPENLKELLPSINEPKEEKSLQWKHFTCDKCFNKDNTPVTAVGEKQWKIHLNSHRHKVNVGKGKRKRDYEEWLAKNQNQNQNAKVEEQSDELKS
ncbi:tRNA delta(2)-isopentenylpyrophosphate transferase [Wickerhamomyces ciferrii]|uniref:tRNA dimethylallyltransferase n=1 Tax=Wickerhamomyces ciferrii (strain ATCC 14091 / BCRC 22168 / CBS 111 / JCM 3599 / NBRC 0793 / NRRL Y-1031 F-60-10) TaxID=1206466 RepID=K0K874_WICCF|nr:tRNA delta(2)-isopentenylpyrophosphate transferase [Wickerhamomyces ciferrii]CCH41025.1 tRNA delta(2)-isopentenylpyrophosphate transferase [Wickerhamomyces ciferrii]